MMSDDKSGDSKKEKKVRVRSVDTSQSDLEVTKFENVTQSRTI